MRRFERIYDVVEPVEEYPMEAITQYTSTMYSTIGTRRQQQVVLKILKADASKDNKELSILLQLSGSALEYPGKNHLMNLLDHFEHHSPNGTHLCLVLLVMISDGEAVTITGRPHYAADIQEVSRQILLGLDFLHTSDIIHCDLQPANITFSPDEDVDLETLLESRRGLLDGVEPSNLMVKIGDLGGAAFIRQREQRPVTPTALRAPELIHRIEWDVGIDIWTLGRLIFELATNEPLFPLGTFGLTAEQIDEEHLYLIGQVLDKNNQTGDTFTQYLTDRLPADFGAENLERLASFLSGMLQEKAQKRMSTAELLRHPFLFR
ncbi:protein kinase [Aspergillus oryzae]|nr:protein kinase [Aspergillus oryzae]QMW44948.1 hypothetical protein G4B11_008368 [Aspergillus flavus]